MKKLFVIALFAISGIFYSGEAKTPYYGGFEFGFFYSSLSPYGKWIQIDAGLVVWRPTIIRHGWAPYKHGRWIWTVDGWYWDSYEPFGHIVFHYGRWYYDDYYGWIWIPDYDWAPAWVEWRYDNDYIGWAPLPPYAVFSIHIGVHYTYNYYTHYSHWHFVKYKHFHHKHVYNYYVAPKYKSRIYSNTKYRNNYSYRDGRVVNYGVDVKYVRERSGQDIRERDIIRTSDYREVEKFRGNDTEKIRTFVATRDQLSRTDVKDMRIEKSDRKSSLESSKISLGNRNENTRTEVQRETPSGRTERDINTNERNQTNQRNDISSERTRTESLETQKKTERNDSNIRTETKKNDTGRILQRNDAGTNQNSNRNEVKRESSNSSNNRNEVRQNEVKRNDSQNNVRIERNQTQKNDTRNDSRVNQRTEVKSNNSQNQNNVRTERNQTQRNDVRTEVKTDTRNNQKTEVKRNDSQNQNQNKRDSGNQRTQERNR